MISVGAVIAVLVGTLVLVGAIDSRRTQDAAPQSDPNQQPAPSAPTPTPTPSTPAQPPSSQEADAPRAAAPATPFPSDDKGFIHSSARCEDTQAAYAIGRTNGSLVVICGEPTGRYEYLGVRLSDAALLRTQAETDAERGFFAQRGSVVYAVSAAELRVTAGSTVIKQEPMVEYREVAR
ncbi:hypothetical protein CQY20_09825 [Mycolicibacterium agri]|uniref:Serine/threonine protein kinase n=1 Tax=Mycolicibacterium agri TaxID=36811 RepID=A0A2A7N6L0_MYCAG|nr:hypothetical protein [Mycolicibacterium agri]PEG39490.1 hypothetical protein CQY20_09825 [Mycolicibacterium agri]GFG48685.1 hypothetical protein MAGR_01260 [Mycolicibacterium agri]